MRKNSSASKFSNFKKFCTNAIAKILEQLEMQGSHLDRHLNMIANHLTAATADTNLQRETVATSEKLLALDLANFSLHKARIPEASDLNTYSLLQTYMPFVCAAARGESDFIRAFAWTQNLEISEEELPAHETYFKKSTRQLIEALSGTINSSCTITPSPKKETPSPQKTGGVSFKTEALDFSLHPAPPKPPSTIFSTNSAFNQSKNSSPTTKESGGRVV